MRLSFIFAATLLAAAWADVIGPWGGGSIEPELPIPPPNYMLFHSKVLTDRKSFVVHFYTLPTSVVPPPYRVSINMTTGNIYRKTFKVLNTDTQTVSQQGYTELKFPLDTMKFPVGDLNDWDNKVSVEVTIDKLNETALKLEEWRSNDQAQELEEPNNEFVLLQTDKAMYKPGQEVRFRVLAVNNVFLSLKGTFNIQVMDAKGNKVKQWKGLKLDANQMFLTESIQLADQVNAGEWKIVIEAPGLVQKQKFEKTFTVEQYVLPTYEVKLVAPDMVLLDDASIEVKVDAKYTFGKPLRGEATVQLMSSSCVQTYNRESVPKELFKTKVGPGESNKVTIPQKIFTTKICPSADEFARQRWRPECDSKKVMTSDWTTSCNLVFNVTVMADVTNEVMRTQTETSLYKHKYKVVFESATPDAFRPGNILPVIMKVKQSNDAPPTEPIKLQIYQFKGAVDNGPQCYNLDSATTLDGELKESVMKASNKTELRELAVKDGGNLLLSVASETPDKFIQIVVNVVDPAGTAKVSCKKFQTIQTRSGHSIALNVVDVKTGTKLKAGETYNFIARTTFDAKTVSFLVSYRGNAIYQGIVSGSKSFTFTYMLPKDTLSEISFIAWTLETTKYEILADGFKQNVEEVMTNQMTAKWAKDQVRPGEKNRLTVETAPSSQIALLAVDKSVLLLKSGNDITLDEVVGTVQWKQGGGRWGPVMYRCGFWCWPGYFPYNDGAFGVFNTANMMVKSDAHVKPQQSSRPPIIYYSARRDPGQPGPMLAYSPASDRKFSYKLEKEGRSEPKTRKHMPETWLMSSGSANSAGKYTLDTTAPDTITEWVLTGFAMSANKGLAVMAEPAKFTTFLPFFGRLQVPVAVLTRGEAVRVTGQVFNYQKMSIDATFSIQQSSEYEVSRDGETYEKTLKLDLSIAADDSGAVAFWLKPVNTIGYIKVTVTAVDLRNSNQDIMEKSLRVDPEGVVQYVNKASFSSAGDSMEFPVKPAKASVVSDSLTLELSAIGDVMGPAIENLGDKIRLPTGCGEQTMVSLAPNVYILQYLEAKNAITPAKKEEAMRFINSGYQRELTYLRNDGGYSAFGNSDKASSTWLTAFVLRCFKQAEKAGYLEPDAEVMAKSYNYLSKGTSSDGDNLYTSDGKFQEFGKVLHKAMKGGSQGDDTRSAYLFLMAVENDIVNMFPDLNNRMIDLATKTSGVFTQAVLAYAFSLNTATQQYSRMVLDSLKTSPMKIESEGLIHWDPNGNAPKKPETDRWAPEPVGPGAIEVTSYILLAQMELDANIENHLPMVRWLMTQRNSLGGFASTQDTVVGLHGLSAFAMKLESGSVDLDIQFDVLEDTQVLLTETFKVAANNMKLLQTRYVSREVSNKATTVKVKLVGSGRALVQSAVKFYVTEEGGAVDSGDFVVDIITDGNARRKRSAESADDGSVWVKGCAAAKPDKETSGMTIIQIGVPSGYSADQTETRSKTTSPDIKLIEFGERKVIAYVDELGTDKRCVNVKMVPGAEVQNSQPVPVLVYSYYNPDQKMEKMLSLPTPKVNTEGGEPEKSSGVPDIRDIVAFYLLVLVYVS